MIKKYLKKLSKTEKFQSFLANILVLYLKFCFATSKIKYEGDYENAKKLIESKEGLAIALWHKYLAFSISFFMKWTKYILPIVSAHSDGAILANIIKKFGCNVISGSTNKGSLSAAREIVKSLKDGKVIVITPDGPKGPACRINSNISSFCKITNSKIIALNFVASRYIEINSWDKMQIPLPFSEIRIKFNETITPGRDKELDDDLLQNQLNQ